MGLFCCFVVLIAILATVFGENLLTAAQYGYSFELQSDAILPPPVDYPFSAPSNGNAYSIMAGTGDAGTSDGEIRSASPTMTAPQFLWKDTNGNIYFTDAKNSLVRKVTKSGYISTMAGNGSPGYAGDGDAYFMAQFNRPRGISGSGSKIVIADTGNARIRTLNLFKSEMELTAGTGTRGYSGDGLLALNADLHAPYGVWVDESNEDIYFTELLKCTIRKIAKSTGIITTVAGVVGTCSTNGDSNPALLTYLNKPRAIFGVSGAESIYFTEFRSNLARKLSGTTITTIAGNGNAKSLTNEGDGGLAVEAALGGPSGIWVDKDTNVYISEAYSSVVRKITAADGKILTVLGVHGKRGPYTKVTDVTNVLYHPRGVYGDDTFHELYLSDTDNHRIISVSLPSPVAAQINTIAGNGAGYNGPYTNENSRTTGLGNLGNMWQDTNGIIYVSSLESKGILKVDPKNNLVSTFAGTGSVGVPVDGAPALGTAFDVLSGLWGDSTGLYACDSSNGLVVKVSWSAGNTVSIIAGGGSTAVSATAIAATDALLPGPYGLWGDAATNILYVTDQTACAIYAIVGGSIVGAGDCLTFPNSPKNIYGETLEGKTYLFFGYSDGLALASLSPLSVLPVPLYGSGIEQIWMKPGFARLYFTQSSLNQVQYLGYLGYPAKVAAGYGDDGFYGDGGDSVIASLSRPIGLWLDTNENLYIADTNNNRVRIVNPLNLLPAPLVPPPTRRLAESEASTVHDSPLLTSIKELFAKEASNVLTFNQTTFPPALPTPKKRYLRQM